MASTSPNRICKFRGKLAIDDPRYVVLVVVDEPQGAMPTAPPCDAGGRESS